LTLVPPDRDTARLQGEVRLATSPLPEEPLRPAPVSLFYSYAHEDGALRDELQGHLKVLERRGLIAPWHDRRIVPGQEWAAEIDDHLRTAELVLLLISKDFIASDYCMGVELQAAMARHRQQEAAVVPIFVRPVDMEQEDADVLPFLRLQGLPTDFRPVTQWGDRDAAWTDVAKGLRATVKAIHARRPPPKRSGRRKARGSHRLDGIVGIDRIDGLDGLQDLLSSAPKVLGAPPEAAGTVPDPVLDTVLDTVLGSMRQAEARRTPIPLDGSRLAAAKADVLSLIDVPAQKRVLWADDSPENNRFEMSLLFKLQIEVVPARSTGEALATIEADREGFDLVISDWEPPGPKEAGLQLLRDLRAGGRAVPVVYYHGASGSVRKQRARKASEAGAVGEAVLPSELIALVREALQMGR
jgi:CheY-like chemotaxis protein